MNSLFLTVTDVSTDLDLAIFIFSLLFLCVSSNGIFKPLMWTHFPFLSFLSIQ